MIHDFADGVRPVTLHTVKARLLNFFWKVQTFLKNFDSRLMTGAAHFENLISGRLTDKILPVRYRFIRRRGIAAMTFFARNVTPRMSAVLKNSYRFVVVSLMTGKAIIRRILLQGCGQVICAAPWHRKTRRQSDDKKRKNTGLNFFSNQMGVALK
jgi:hypothetical protein